MKLKWEVITGAALAVSLVIAPLAAGGAVAEEALPAETTTAVVEEAMPDEAAQPAEPLAEPAPAPVASPAIEPAQGEVVPAPEQAAPSPDQAAPAPEQAAPSPEEAAPAPDQAAPAPLASPAPGGVYDEEVTPTLTYTEPSCESPGTVTFGPAYGVVWADPVVNEDGSTTYSASPADGFFFPEGAVIEWTVPDLSQLSPYDPECLPLPALFNAEPTPAACGVQGALPQGLAGPFPNIAVTVEATGVPLEYLITVIPNPGVTLMGLDETKWTINDDGTATRVITLEPAIPFQSENPEGECYQIAPTVEVVIDCTAESNVVGTVSNENAVPVIVSWEIDYDNDGTIDIAEDAEVPPGVTVVTRNFTDPQIAHVVVRYEGSVVYDEVLTVDCQPLLPTVDVVVDCEAENSVVLTVANPNAEGSVDIDVAVDEDLDGTPEFTDSVTIPAGGEEVWEFDVDQSLVFGLLVTLDNEVLWDLPVEVDCQPLLPTVDVVVDCEAENNVVLTVANPNAEGSVDIDVAIDEDRDGTPDFTDSVTIAAGEEVVWEIDYDQYIVFDLLVTINNEVLWDLPVEVDCAPLVPGDIGSACIGEVPYLAYELTLPEGFTTDDPTPVTITMVNPEGEDYVIEDQPLSGSAVWPGASATPPLQWPGWTLQNGVYVPTDGNFAWTRDGITVLFEVNPTYETFVEYPPASAICANPENPAPAPAGKPSGALAVTGSPDMMPWGFGGAAALALGFTLLTMRRFARR